MGRWAGRRRGADVLVASVLILLAVAKPSGAEDESSIYDPWEGMNRGIFAFNDAADKYVLRPVAVGYQWLLPGFLRTGINNFFDNISYPVDILNALLQGKPTQFASDSARFLLNSTVGLAGILDPATVAGLASTYITRCEQLRADPPADWDGVWAMTSK